MIRWAALGTSLVLAGCSLAGDVTPPPGLAPLLPASPAQIEMEGPARAPDTEAGALLYAENCSPCHGSLGQGDGPEAGSLPFSPPPLGDPGFSRRAVPADWFRIVTAGDLDRFMPPFVSLTADERWDVVVFSLGLSLSPEEVARGETLFLTLCRECHSPADSAPDLPDRQDVVGRTLADLMASVRDGVPPSMPAFGSRLSEGDLWAVTDYARRLSLRIAPAAEESAAAPTLSLVVVGEVRNGTAGEAPPAEVEIELHAFHDGQPVGRDTVTAAAGEYEFDSVPAHPGWLMVASMEYGGVVYLSEAKAVVGDESRIELPITIFETTESEDAIRMEQLHVLFDFPSPGILQVVEVMNLSNTGDRTVVPGGDGTSLSIPLPERIFHLDWEDPNAFQSFRRTPTGFDLLLPLRPGNPTSTLVFRFELPYNRGLSFRQPIPWSTAGGLLLVPRGGPRVIGGSVQAEGVREVEGTQVEVYAIGPLAAGQTLGLELGGSATGEPAALWVIGALAIGGSLVLARRWLSTPMARRQ